ncbi:MAG TPA: tautomerase family protein, partial [Magnetospirillaceae bacterium]|nr:tautomerase family protein [Magnetospirillaceae bacterium]
SWRPSLLPNGSSRRALPMTRANAIQLSWRRIAGGLHDRLKLRREDVFINLVAVGKENWSFGNGLAQYSPE